MTCGNCQSCSVPEPNNPTLKDSWCCGRIFKEGWFCTEHQHFLPSGKGTIQSQSYHSCKAIQILYMHVIKPGLMFINFLQVCNPSMVHRLGKASPKAYSGDFKFQADFWQFCLELHYTLAVQCWMTTSWFDSVELAGFCRADLPDPARRFILLRCV